MFCSKCGKEINDDAVICIHCGCSVKQITNKKRQNNSGCFVVFIILTVLFFIGIIAAVVLAEIDENLIANGEQQSTSNKQCIPINWEIYDSIKLGGSYKQLEKLKDYCGELAVETQIDNYASGGLVVFYGKPLGSNANFSIMNGKIVAKSQIGLK